MYALTGINAKADPGYFPHDLTLIIPIANAGHNTGLAHAVV
jgi:hypothetical protein